MEKFIISWPLVCLILGIFALVLIRSELRDLIKRTKKVGKAGLETCEPQDAQITFDNKGIQDFFKEYESPLLLEAEAKILEELKVRNIESPTDREKALIRSLASMHLISFAEKVYSVIWHSQVNLLRSMNSNNIGLEFDQVHPFYDTAKSNYPHMYVNYSFEQWLNFLASFNLIVTGDARWFISVAGREFLKYLVATGRPDPTYG